VTGWRQKVRTALAGPARRAGSALRLDDRPNRLVLVTGGGDWVLKRIAEAVRTHLRTDYPDAEIVGLIGQRPFLTRANVHFLCRPAFFTAGGIPDVHASNRIVVSWLHGGRRSPEPQLRAACDQLERHWRRVRQVIVPNRTTYENVLECGVDPARVHVIPNGVDTFAFRRVNSETRARMRARLGLGADAFVVGSFQRDEDDAGIPKMIKGPDTLVGAVSAVHRARPIEVLLAGPGRTWVNERLREAGVPHVHHWAKNDAELAEMYHALDTYLITSREEGGPTALRESMASGVPVVSTRMGLAADLIVHGVNGLLAEVADHDGLAKHVLALIENPSIGTDLAEAALRTIAALDFKVIAARYRDEVYALAFA
jgi:glycosyltransferase involved in cell wall biosynthesis